MKFIEFIRVRSSAAELQVALPSLYDIVTEIGDPDSAVETFVLQHAIYDGDLAVVIVRKNALKAEMTREGLLVADHLSSLGSIDHAVWVPADLPPESR